MPPWWLILLGASLALGWLAWATRRTRAAAPLLNLGAALFALTCFEFYLDLPYFTKAGNERIETSVKRFMLDDDLLGYAPKKNSQVRVRNFRGDVLVYDAVYTIGENGLRLTPPHQQGDLAGCIVFFGDSFNFGDGVNDEETYPYQVGRRLGVGYATHNFAFSGYGPHQMLAALQAGRVDTVADCRPTHFIYLFIPAHVARVAGTIDSYRAQPRYRLDGNGRVIRDGTFRDPLRLFGRLTLPQTAVDTFRIWQRLFGRNRAQRPADLALAVAVVRESILTTRARYPGSEFHAILYDDAESNDIDALEAGLNAMGVQSHRIHAIVPDLRANIDRYRIPIDGHPTGRLYALLAEYIANTVILPNKHEAEPAAH